MILPIGNQNNIYAQPIPQDLDQPEFSLIEPMGSESNANAAIPLQHMQVANDVAAYFSPANFLVQ